MSGRGRGRGQGIGAIGGRGRGRGQSIFVGGGRGADISGGGARGAYRKLTLSINMDDENDEPADEPPDDFDERISNMTSKSAPATSSSSTSRHKKLENRHASERVRVGARREDGADQGKSSFPSSSQGNPRTQRTARFADNVGINENDEEAPLQKEDLEADSATNDQGDKDTIPGRVATPAATGRKHRKALVVHKLGSKSIQDASTLSAGGLGVAGDRRSRKVTDMMNSAIANLKASRFEKWKNDELILLLVKNGVVVRNESGQAHSSLVAMADSSYEGREMPDKPTPYSQFDLDRVDPIVRKIQELFINRSALKREEETRETLFARPNDGDDAQYAELDIMDVLAANSDGDEEEEDYNAESGNDGDKWWFANPIKAKKSNKEYVKQSTRDIEMGRHAPSEHQRGTSEFGRGTNYDFADGDLIDPEDKERMRRNRKRNSRAVQILDIPWMPPNWDKAKEFMNYNRPRQGGKGGKKFHFRSTTTGRHCHLGGCGEMCDILREGQTSEFGIYGPGVTNYFKFTKWLFWLFFILSIFAVPELMLNFLGPINRSGMTDLYTTTVGNLSPKTFNETIYIEVPLCPYARTASVSLFAQDFNCAITRNTLGVFYSGFDILMCLTVLFAFGWIRVFEKEEEVMLDKNTVFASMYTLQVKNLPPGCDEAKLRHHIRDVLNNPKSVVAVHIALDNEDEYLLCVERGKHIKERTQLINRHRYDTTRIRMRAQSSTKDTDSHAREGEALIKKLRKTFIQECLTVDKNLRAVEIALRQIEDKAFKPICAFVTFDSVYHLEKCMHAFAPKTIWSCYDANPKVLLDGNELTISRASEPSTIIWENLRYSFKERMYRRNITTALALLLIFVSIVCTYIAKILQDNAQTSSGSGLCPENFSSLSPSQQKAAVQQNSQILHCYCDNLTYEQKASDSNCRALVRQEVNTQLVTYFASVIVLLVNVGMEFAMQAFSNIEKHQSEDTQGRSVLIRLFALKYINTSCVFLVNSNIQGLTGLTTAHAHSGEFSKDWYKSVGVSIILVQLGNIILSHSKKFYDYFMYKRAIRKAKRDEAELNASVLTQDELNKLHEGPVFEFPINYAQLMVTYFVCMTFSAGMPILYLIGMVNFGVSYLVDKYLFINLYRIPNRFSTKIGRMATALVPWGIIVHLFIAIWSLSNNTIFRASTSDEAVAFMGRAPAASADKGSSGLTSTNLKSKVYEYHTFPLFVLLIIIVLLRVVFFVLEQLGSAGGVLVNAVFDSGYDTVPKDSVAYQVGYSRAVQRNLIKGLTSYNILHHPKYKELFQISWKFAFSHHHLKSVRLDKPVVDEFDNDAVKVEKQRRATVFTGRTAGMSEFSRPSEIEDYQNQGHSHKPFDSNSGQSSSSSHHREHQHQHQREHQREHQHQREQSPQSHSDSHHNHRPPPPDMPSNSADRSSPRRSDHGHSNEHGAPHHSNNGSGEPRHSDHGSAPPRHSEHGNGAPRRSEHGSGEPPQQELSRPPPPPSKPPPGNGGHTHRVPPPPPPKGPGR